MYYVTLPKPFTVTFGITVPGKCNILSQEEPTQHLKMIARKTTPCLCLSFIIRTFLVPSHLEVLHGQLEGVGAGHGHPVFPPRLLRARHVSLPVARELFPGLLQDDVLVRRKGLFESGDHGEDLGAGLFVELLRNLAAGELNDTLVTSLINCSQKMSFTRL